MIIVGWSFQSILVIAAWPDLSSSPTATIGDLFYGEAAGWLISLSNYPQVSSHLKERGFSSWYLSFLFFSRQCYSFPSHVEQKWLIVLKVKLENSKTRSALWLDSWYKVSSSSGMIISHFILFSFVPFSTTTRTHFTFLFRPFPPRSIKTRTDWMSERMDGCVYIVIIILIINVFTGTERNINSKKKGIRNSWRKTWCGIITFRSNFFFFSSIWHSLFVYDTAEQLKER